jgi:phenylalanyl-tRNA synthetase alpha chain
MQDELNKIKDKILAELGKIKDNDTLREVEIKYLGRKGELSTILKSIKDLSAEEKKKFGQLANEVKKDIEARFTEIKNTLDKNRGKDEFIDVTLPGKQIKQGRLHPITQVQSELEDFFTAMGFMVLDGPELESDYYNFQAVNIPKHHPARDMQDTFYVDMKNKEGEYDLVMRTQTSPVQVRAMEKYGAPLRAIVPGRCFRCEATDVRHEHTLYQLEGLVVDKDINFSHMKAILEAVGKKLYGPETKLRMRPKYYPFVEPGSNGEYTCSICNGKGCRLCKQTGWLEILGCGMMHPNVLKAGGVDPKKYSGFAFGFGLGRLTQLKYGIDDNRLFMSGDMRFLNQFN